MRLCYDLDEENNTKPTFKWVRIVKLVNGCYLVCSCNLHENIGIGCVHVATTIDDITVHFWHIMHRKSCSFYYLREGTTESMNKMFEDLELKQLNERKGMFELFLNFLVKEHYFGELAIQFAHWSCDTGQCSSVGRLGGILWIGKTGLSYRGRWYERLG